MLLMGSCLSAHMSATPQPLHTSVNSTTEELQSVQTTLLPPPSHSQLTAFPSNAGVVEAEVVPEVVPVVLGLVVMVVEGHTESSTHSAFKRTACTGRSGTRAAQLASHRDLN